MWTFNYGEWTEAYVFLRLLAYGRIYSANAVFEPDTSIYMDIKKITRHEKNHILEYKRLLERDIVIASDNDEPFRTLNFAELNDKADFLFEAMRNVSDNKRKFPVPDIETYLMGLRFSQPKIPKLPDNIAELYGKKADIILEVEESIDHAVSTTGFSIKSHLGGESSLFNSGLASRFKYEIVGCTDDDMNELNGNKIDRVKDGMIKYIKDKADLSLNFVETSEEFKSNLDFLELRMVDILQYTLLMLLGYYDEPNTNNTKDIVAKIADKDPIGVTRKLEWYEAKFKSLLFASFSGLTAKESWDGRHRLSGGYIDVNRNGELLYYRALSDDVFNSYLYEHTYFDRPDRGVNKDIYKITAKAHLEGREPTEEELDRVKYKLNDDGTFKLKNGRRIPEEKKGDWGYVFKENERYYININFQIRFR